MNDRVRFDRAKDIGTGLAFVIFPLVFVFAFAGHSGLLSPHFLSPEEIIMRARGDAFLQFGHALVTLNTGFLVVVSIHFMKLLDGSSSRWAGLIGAVLAVLGALMLAADKGALCLTSFRNKVGSFYSGESCFCRLVLPFRPSVCSGQT
jgi:hypothetical protein